MFESAPALLVLLMVLLLLPSVFLLFLEHLYRTARLFNYKRQNYGEAKNSCPHHEILKAPLPRHPYMQYLKQ
jgi:hypothetical protein